ncbi:MAG TPA: hypothetical protein PKY77_00145 [Phycisphaerae bacterium]|nr:hypothetical protein [Phycisphaerae bacterium]HRY69679.1 hypothetical protein [Phycisphaerae bacterium]HSA25124.1 hypothetical protein [Phycisphaerae bacterium]
MGKLTFVSQHARRVSIVMMAVAALMLIDGVYQTSMHLRWRHWLPATLAAGGTTTQPAGSQPTESPPSGSRPATSRPAETRPSGTRPAATQPAVAPTATQAKARPPAQPSANPSEPPAVSAAIRKRSIFAPPRPKTPRPTLTGVLGRVALFRTADGKTVGIAEGESGHGMKVKTIRDYEVVVEYEGKTDTMKLFSDPGSSGSPAPRTETEPDRRSRR